MLKNYLVVTLRSFSRSKLVSFINIFGLSFGIACAILIIQFVKDEVTFDRYHANSERLYRVYTFSQRGERQNTNTATPFSMGKQLWENYEEVEKYSVFTPFNDIVERGGLSFTENVQVAGSHLFEMFDYNVLSGTVAKALEDPKDVVITREIAEKYFASAEASGKSLTIRIDGQPVEFQVKAVIENPPSNTSVPFDLVISDHYLKDLYPEPMLTSWNMIVGENYIMLRKGVDPDGLAPKFSSLVSQVLGDDMEGREFNIYLQPLTDIHLNVDLPAANAPVSDPKYILILSAVAFLIVAMASINFVNLSLGRSFSRTKEIGIRKSAGASKNQLMLQFLGESISVSFISLICGLLLAFLALPVFNELSGKSLEFVLSIQNLVLYALLALSIGLLSGLYPAIVMSSFKPVTTLKGNVNLGREGRTLRLVLIGGQFVLSIFLISVTLIMTGQLQFLQDKNLGFDKEHIVVIPLNVEDARGVRESVSKGLEKSERLIRELQGKLNIVSAAATSHIWEPGNWTEVGWIDENDQRYSFFMNTVNEHYLETMAMQLAQGRDFNVENESDRRRSIIVNEAFVDAFNLENPIGARIPNQRMDDHEIIGVVKDFHIESLHVAIAPLVITQNMNIGFSGAQSIGIGSSPTPKVAIRVAPGSTQQALKTVTEAWNKVYPGEPFDYVFLDENLKQQYLAELNLGKIMKSASVVAVLIGCMGLFGLAMLTLTSRLKEVGIRKVLGANSISLWLVLSRSFLILIAVAMLVSSPFAWYAMDEWLNNFEYRIEVNPLVFLAAGLFTLVIAVITISYQMFRVLRTNPVQVLRSE